MGTFAEQFIEGYRTGRQLKMQREEAEQRRHDRDLERDVLKHRISALKIQEQLEARGAIQQAALSRPPEVATFPDQEPTQAQPFTPPGGTVPLHPAPINAQVAPREIPLAGVPVPGVDFGPNGSIPPSVETRGLADVVRTHFSQKVQEAMLNPTFMSKQLEIANPRPVAVAPGGTLVNPQTGRPTFTAPNRPDTSVTPYEDLRSRDPERRARAKEWLQLSKPAAAYGPAGMDAASEIAGAIIRGEQPPTTTGLYRYGAAVRAELAKQGYNLSTAQLDWQAVQRHIQTLNGQQQERLRQAISFTHDSLDIIENLFEQWKQAAGVSGFRGVNKGVLAITKQIPGEKGAIAQALDAQINDLTSELGTVYKGGNTSTDESLRLAAQNLKADWNEATFKKALGVLRQNLRIRQNSILNSQAVGLSPNSQYRSPVPASVPAPGVPANRDPLGIR